MRQPSQKRCWTSLVVLIWGLLSFYPLFSQPKLVLSRIGNKNRVIFNEGDEIRLKVRGADNYVGGPILGLRDSVIHFRFFDIHLDSIASINIEGRYFGGFNTGQYGPVIMVAGLGYLAVDALNQENVTGDTFIQAGSIIGVGYILYAIRRKQFKVKGRNRIYIIK